MYSTTTEHTAFSNRSIDNVREYWNRRPCNIRHSTEPVGTRTYFDQVEARKYFVEPHIPGFAQFERWAGKRVLEVGCGIGTDTMNFARAGAQVTAVDLSSASLDLARRRAEVFGLQDRITFVPGDLLDEASMIEVIRTHRPHEVYNLAAQSFVQTSFQQPVLTGETTALGVPCLTLRENTERPVTVDEGTNTMVGCDPSKIIQAAAEVLAGKGKAGRQPQFWDGRAAERIVAELGRQLGVG